MKFKKLLGVYWKVVSPIFDSIFVIFCLPWCMCDSNSTLSVFLSSIFLAHVTWHIWWFHGNSQEWFLKSWSSHHLRGPGVPQCWKWGFFCGPTLSTNNWSLIVMMQNNFSFQTKENIIFSFSSASIGLHWSHKGNKIFCVFLNGVGLSFLFF